MKNNIIADTFKWLFIGLLICFGVSYFTSSSEEIFIRVYTLLGSSTIFIYLILELVLCVVLSLFITKISPLMPHFFSILYTALTGFSLSVVFIIYPSSSIAIILLDSAIL